jgi:hypothetical protein
MALLQTVTGFGYELVQQTWIASTVLIKPAIVLHIAKLVYDERINLKHLEEVLLDYSRPTVGVMFLTGLFFTLLGLEAEPVFKVFSQLLALTYYGFLFWKF